MDDRKDAFKMTKELGARLQGLRKRAQLTQSGLAHLVGRGWDHAFVSRVETAELNNPGLGVIADYLRACRASFSEIADLLDEYTAQPLPADKEAREAVLGVTEALPRPIGDEALRYDVKTSGARRAEVSYGSFGVRSSDRDCCERVTSCSIASASRGGSLTGPP